jgi:hypothetical protein
LLKNGSRILSAPLPYRSSLAFKRTGFEVLLQTKGRNFTFLKEKENPLLEHFERKDFIHGLPYLADILNHMNEIHLSIQCPEVIIMDATEKLQAFSANFAFCFYAVCVT